MVLAAPEFVVAERIELLDEIEVAAELQHRMLANRVMRGEEGSEFEARHLFLSGRLLLFLGLLRRLRAELLQGNRGRAWRPMRHGAMRAADGSPGVSGCRPPPSCPRTARPPQACATASPRRSPTESRTTDRSAAAPVPRARRDIARNQRRANRFPARCRVGGCAAARHPIIPSTQAG